MTPHVPITQFQQLPTCASLVSFYFLLTVFTLNYFETDPPAIFRDVSLKEDKIDFFV